MSVIRKNPYVESVLNTLTSEELAAFLTVLNTGGNNVNVSLVTGTLQKGEGKPITSTITPVYIQLDEEKNYTAILIWNASHCTAIAYHRFPDVKLFKINVTNKTYEEIKEPCDINELRRIVVQMKVKNLPDEIPSAFTYKGAVDDVEDLPSTGNEIGDCYTVVNDDNSEYIWTSLNGTDQWLKLGTNNAVLKVAQTLTDTEKAQVATNLGAVSLTFTYQDGTTEVLKALPTFSE